ncbi:UDP-N-acetylmuramoyl-tripeptide--D-alanyl-D-alanine ligase [uncultured Lacinutrix sp.]|uniref:UDP-N-acetylmuramoyl-tripeptide--D-alanyl-D- alanine ligase n=1 Tax=uncultured Lacinutrix sp. TaxID=574032 RepID=UPI002617FB70|nr:UDP-N-acetylmuramoyl-tripeptide--D-alanyl-D-alanine ligase [uncultured Lacinutrix sp.]
MKINYIHSLFLDCNSISTDTRKVSQNNLFFALKGDNFNGNKFAKMALEKGAKYAIVDEAEYNTSSQTILVDDSLATLQALATYHRNYLNTPIIALTGSNGKTTTKELINATLSQKYNTTATVGNLNNHIGVPLTILSMTKETEIGIVEMGANHLKEIEFLCEIAKPDFGYITNFGKAHLEGFGGIEGVIKGKSELYKFLMDNDKHIFLNADDNLQKEKLNAYTKKIGFSKTDENYYNIISTNANPFVSLKADNVVINSNLIGEYNFTNICAAVIIAKHFNVDINSIKKGIENYVPTNNRSQIITKSTNKIILDAYNANPSSMKAALSNFENLSDSSKIVILGDMFELGSSSEEEHQEISNLIEKLNIQQAILVGEHFYKSTSNLDYIKRYESFEDLKEVFDSNSYKNATILIKGSRGMALERILDLL